MQQPKVRGHVDHFGSSDEGGILKDFTPKAVEKAQNIIKDRIKTGIQNKGKVKFSLENYFWNYYLLLLHILNVVPYS